MDFYHHLIGDGNYGDSYANLLEECRLWRAGPVEYGLLRGRAVWRRNTRRLLITRATTRPATIRGTERTIVTAVNRRRTVGRHAELCRGTVPLLHSAWLRFSAGTYHVLYGGRDRRRPNPFTVNTFTANKEDLDWAAEQASGKFLFRFYQDLIRFVLRECGGTIECTRCYLQSTMIIELSPLRALLPGQNLLVVGKP